MAAMTLTFTPACARRGRPDQIDRRTRPLHNHIAMPGLTWSKIANDIQPFGGGFEIGIGKRAAVGHRKIRPGHFQDNNAHLGLSGAISAAAK